MEEEDDYSGYVLTKFSITELCYLLSHRLNIRVTYHIDDVTENDKIHYSSIYINDNLCSFRLIMGKSLIGDLDMIVGSEMFKNFMNDLVMYIHQEDF